MQKLWKKLAVAVATVCLATGGVFCFVGCGDNTKSGTSYQYKATSYTDTYNLYEDGSYERTYEGSPYIGEPILEIGTYKTNGSLITFTGDSAWGDGESWPSAVSLSKYRLPSYSGSLTTNLSISGTTYTKHGSITKTSN
ncbi:MAG: hypothetical protein HDR32_06200 [Treponema sp.]|nr:hypothetical protein [Treponema sp.]